MPEITTWQNSPLNADGCALSCTFTADFARDRGLIYEKLKLHPYISQMTLNVSWNTDPNQSSAHAPIRLKSVENTDRIYSDKELNEMITAERILEIDSATDKTVISYLYGGKSVTENAAACFFNR